MPGALWLIGLVVVPTLFAAGATVVGRNQLEKTLTDQAVSALAEGDLSAIHVVFEARDATLEVPFGVEVTGEQVDRAKSLVEAIEGVHVVNAPEVPR